MLPYRTPETNRTDTGGLAALAIVLVGVGTIVFGFASGMTVAMLPLAVVAFFSAFLLRRASRMRASSGSGTQDVVPGETKVHSPDTVPETPGAGLSDSPAGDEEAQSSPGGFPKSTFVPRDILVVEDEAGVRRLICEILRRHGHRVRDTRDGVEALELLRTGYRPALVLTDLVMPTLGGPGLARAMVAQGWRIPVLFMTGYQDDSAESFDDDWVFVSKPFTSDTLISAVNNLLSSTR